MTEYHKDGRRYSHISKAWILESDWSDREEAAALRAELDLMSEKLEHFRAALSRIMWTAGDSNSSPAVIKAAYERCFTMAHDALKNEPKDAP